MSVAFQAAGTPTRRDEFLRRAALLNRVVATVSLLNVGLTFTWFALMWREPLRGPLFVISLPVVLLGSSWGYRFGLTWAMAPLAEPRSRGFTIASRVGVSAIALIAVLALLLNEGPLPVRLMAAGMIVVVGETFRSFAIKYAELLAATVRVRREATAPSPQA